MSEEASEAVPDAGDSIVEGASAAGGSAPLPADEVATGSPATSLFGGLDPFQITGGAAPLSGPECDGYFWCMEDDIVVPHDGGSTSYGLLAANRAWVWGPEGDGTDGVLHLANMNGGNSYLMVMDANEIDTNKRLYLNKNSHEDVILVRSGGKVGIGNAWPPDYLLDVGGTIRAEELILEVAFPDYVFEPGYDLMSLGEVEQYIAENGRLPGLPSASEVQNHGLPVGDAHALLLQKVEELTLHLIEQGKQIEELRARVAECGRAGPSGL